MLLSPKHGVNPTIPLCFFCGESKNELILCGRLKDDAEAPKGVFFNYEPCDKCKEQMSQGITLIEVSDKENKNPPIQEGCYPTGWWCVIKEEAAMRMFYSPMSEQVLKHRKAFIDTEIGNMLREASKS